MASDARKIDKEHSARYQDEVDREAAVLSRLTSLNSLHRKVLPEVELLEDDSYDENVGKLSNKQKWTLINLALVNLVTNMSYSIIAPIYPPEASIRGISNTMSGFVFSISAIAVVLLSSIFGRSISIIGPKFMFVASLFVVGSCNMLFGVLDYVEDGATFLELSLAIRFIEGCGTAALITSDFAITIHYFPGLINVVFAILEMCCGIGMSLGPALGGFIYSILGFGPPFYFLGGIVLLSAPISLYILPTINSEPQKNLNEMSSWRLLVNVDAIVTIMAIVMCAAAWAFIDPILEPHLQQYGFDVKQVSVAFLFTSVIYGLFSPLFGWLLQQGIMPHVFMIFGFFGIALAYLLIGPSPYLPFLPSNGLMVLFALGVLGIAFALAIIPTLDTLKNNASEIGFPNSLTTYGLVSGIWTSAFYFGETIGPILAGSLYDKLGGVPMAGSVMSLLNFVMVFIIIIYLLVRAFMRKRKQSDTSVREVPYTKNDSNGQETKCLLKS